MLEVKYLGQFSVQIGGKTIEIPSRPAQCLFIYLVLHKGTPVRRDSLASLFWPDSGESQARSNLRHALWRLRKAFDEALTKEGEFIRADDETILFEPPSDAWIDVVLLDREIDASSSIEDMVESLSVYQGELLPGFYEDWIIKHRERFKTNYEGKMQMLLERLMGAGWWAETIEWGERWIALGGAPEVAYRALMIAHSHQDDLSSVSAIYQRCVTNLHQEGISEPSEGTRVLYGRIMEGEKPIPPPVTRFESQEAPPAPGTPPYKGLQYFDQKDADLFFGREALTAKLIARLTEIEAGNGSPLRFLAVVGASGSGKSSLLRAGLIPALRRGESFDDGTHPPILGKTWPIHVIEPSAHPLETLAIELTHDSEPITETAKLAEALAHNERALHLYLSKKIDLIPPDEKWITLKKRTLLVIDQFEELFTLCRSETEREAFVNNLMAAVHADGPTIVVIALRADFYAHCSEYPSLRQALEQNQAYIGPMSEEELRRAMMEPASNGGWSFEPGLVEFLMDEVGDEPGALPLLSHVLLETWRRRRGRTLTFVGYNETGGLRNAIAQTADRVFGGFDHRGQYCAQNIFTRLTEFGEGTQDTRRRVKLEELVGNPEDKELLNAVLQKLADARLITISEDSVDVAHEVLIREWPTLRLWLDENREALQIQRHLTESAQAWERLERDTGELYRGARLAQAIEWAETHGDEMNPLECEFLDASNTLARNQEAERETQRQRELEAAQKLAAEEKKRAEEQTRAGQRFRRLAIVLGILLLVVAGLAFVTLQQTNLANEQTNVAKARELAAIAIKSLEVDPERSILLARQAVNETLEKNGYILKEAEEALHQAVNASRLLMVITTETNESQRFVDFSPDGEKLVSSWGFVGYGEWQASRDFKIWDLETGGLIQELPGYQVATSWPHGDHLITGVPTAQAVMDFVIWDPMQGEKLSSTNIVLHGHPLSYNCDPELSRIVFTHKNANIIIYDLTSGELILTIEQENGLPVTASVFSPDGEYLATGSSEGPINIWDTQSGENLNTLLGHTGIINDITYSADGRFLATASEDGTAIVWDVSSGENLVTLLGHTNEVTGITFSEDRRYLATASRDRSVILWDLPASIETGIGQALFTLAGHQDAVQGVAINPEGNRLASASLDGTIRIWDISPSGGSEGHVFIDPELKSSQGKTEAARSSSIHWLMGERGPSDLVANKVSVALNREGTRLAVATSDATPQIWDATSGQLLLTLIGHEKKVPTLTFSPDGVYILTRSYDPPGTSTLNTPWENSNIKIWDVSSGKEIISIPDIGQDMSELAFSPDGELLAVGNSYRDVSILDFPRLLDGDLEAPDLVTAKVSTQLDEWVPLGIDFSPQGDKIVTSMGGSKAGIWDAATGENLQKLSGHESDCFSVAYNPNGNQVATASADGTARIWDVETGESLFTLSGHTGAVISAVFSPDGSRLATASMDGSAKIWDTKTGEELLTLYGNKDGIMDVVFSPDGRQLYTAGMDGTVRVHLLDIEALIELAQQRLTRTLTEEECKEFLHMEACPPLYSR